MNLFHVVEKGSYYKEYEGFKRAKTLAKQSHTKTPQVLADPALANLRKFKKQLGYHNIKDIKRGFANLDFAPEARPWEDEGIAENGNQLFALCQKHGINHLIYAGFAINWCLLLSPGGMAEMRSHGLMCSTLRQAVTAVENKETARRQLAKELALWRIAVDFGFVFDADELVQVLGSRSTRP